MAGQTDTGTGMAPVVPGIKDPATCGEDLAANLQRIISLAGTHCDGCADYHVTNAAIRLLDNAPWRQARIVLLDALRPCFNELAAEGDRRIDVVVAGSADSAVLSTCAHAAATAGEDVLDRTRFTVLDQCRSPLVLCEAHAARNGLRAQTEAVDLTSTQKTFPADLIVIHHLLPFVAENQHLKLLRRLRSWLKPGGRLIIWHDVAPEEDEEPNRLIRESRIATIKAQVDDGEIIINEPRDAFFARLDNYIAGTSSDPDSISNIESVKRLISSAGLNIQSLDERPHTCPTRMRRYLMFTTESREMTNPPG